MISSRPLIGQPPPFLSFYFFIFFSLSNFFLKQKADIIGFGASIRIGREIRCLLYTGFLRHFWPYLLLVDKMLFYFKGPVSPTSTLPSWLVLSSSSSSFYPACWCTCGQVVTGCCWRRCWRLVLGSTRTSRGIFNSILDIMIVVGVIHINKSSTNILLVWR